MKSFACSHSYHLLLYSSMVLAFFFWQTYDGMIVGEHSRDSDLDVRRKQASLFCALCYFWMNELTVISLSQVNPVRTKELTNVRAASKDENVRLTPPRLVCNG